MRFLYSLFCLIACVTSYSQNHSVGFIENKGQVMGLDGKPNKEVKFLLNTSGLNVQLRAHGFSYDVYEMEGSVAAGSTKTEPDTPQSMGRFRFHRIDIEFEDANKNVELVTGQMAAGFDNYYNTQSADGVIKVHSFNKVTYRNVYDNIDVEFFIPDDKSKPVEYNFIIRPGGNMRDIRLKFNGAKTKLTGNRIRMETRFGRMEETIPLSWIQEQTAKTEITVHYRNVSRNVYGFESNHDVSNETVVIDPVPIRLWGTYFYRNGGTDTGTKIRTDTSGNVLLSGMAMQNSNIATSGVFQTTADLNTSNSYLTKFDALGQRLWTTYVANYPTGAILKDFAVNSQGSSYLVGYTWGGQGPNASTALATPGSHKPAINSFYNDSFIVKLDPDGVRIWGTYFGGDDREVIETISLDSAENLIVAGSTHSLEQIATANSYMENSPHTGSFYEAGFFSKFSPGGQQLYGSYFNKGITGSTVDANNNIFFTGQYYIGSEFPNIATPGAHQESVNGTDIFLVKFNQSFQQEWLTYYGGNEYTTSFGNSDRCAAILTDNLLNVYLVGTTSSSNNIATPGSFKSALPNNTVNGFIAKFTTGGQRLWGTYYGANAPLYSTDTCESAAINKDNGDLYLMGNTRHATYYGNSNSFQPTSDGSDECYISKFDSSGFPVWSTYYGTESQDYSESISYSNNFIFCSGLSSGIATNGNDLGTPGTFMPTGGGYKTFVAKFQDCMSAPEALSNGPVCLGETIQLNATGGTGYSWSGPNGFTSTLPDPVIPNADASHSGQYLCTITGTGGCDGTIVVTVTVGDTTPPVPDVTALPSITGDCNITVNVIPVATDNCAGPIPATTSDPVSYSLPGSYTIIWTYDDGNGNTTTQNQTVTINPVSLPVINAAQTFCVDENATLASIAATGQNIIWYDAASGGNIVPDHTVLADGITYYASQTINGCESLTSPVTVTIHSTPPPAGSALQTLCSEQFPTLQNIIITGTDIIWYGSMTGTTALPDSTVLANGVTYYASQTLAGCESTTRLAVTVTLIDTLSASNYFEAICDDDNDGQLTISLQSFEDNLITGPAAYSFGYYTSSTGAEGQLAAEAITSISAYPLQLGLNTVFVRIDSPGGCHQIVTLNLTLIASPRIMIDDTIAVCENSIVTINAGSGFDSYLWSTGATQPQISVGQPGSYWVTVTKVTNGTICSGTKNFTVEQSGAASITGIETLDWTDYDNTIIVNVAGSGEYLYSLDNINFQGSNVFHGVSAGPYTVYVSDKYGCGTVMEDIYLLMYPRFFTPNGDGVNDYWSVKFAHYEPGLKVSIYDRYGKFLKMLDHQTAWDGKLNGHELPATDYWFVVSRNSGKEYRGHFALKR